jgi:hypothetical protein
MTQFGSKRSIVLFFVNYSLSYVHYNGLLMKGYISAAFLVTQLALLVGNCWPCFAKYYPQVKLHEINNSVKKGISRRHLKIYFFSKTLKGQCQGSRSFNSFSLPYTNTYFCFASLKLLTNFEIAYCNPPQVSLLCDWSMFSDLSLAAGKCERINLSQVGLGISDKKIIPRKTE